ncbi:MAG: ABC transporter permease [Christensenellales bacterium]|jgi:putative aldouronate transport system permease protein
MTALSNKRTAVQQRDRVLRKLWKTRYVYLMLLPVVLYFALFKYWPMYWLRMAFYDFKILRGFDGSKFVGAKHFVRFFDSTDFWMLLNNTLKINFSVLVFVFPVPILFALLLNEVRNPSFKKTIQTVSYLPYFISTMIVVTMLNTLLSPSMGVVNRIIKALGGEAVYFMGSEKYFRPVYILSAIWQNTGWSAIVYLCALTSIDPSLYEAAIVDGAGRLRQVWHITLPGIRSTIVIMFILQLGKIMNVGFEKVYLMQNDLNLGASEVISTYLYKTGIINANYSYSTAIGLFNSVINFAMILLSNTISRKAGDVSLW